MKIGSVVSRIEGTLEQIKNLQKSRSYPLEEKHKEIDDLAKRLAELSTMLKDANDNESRAVRS